MTESEVPTLGLGSEQRQMWTQTVMTLAYGVRERRQALGQLAWSDEQTAQRRQERTARIADPTVRAMSADEWTEAVDRRQRRHGGERHTRSGAGWVTVWIGPLNDGRTALLASAGPTGSTTPTATAAVSCADTPTAMELADRPAGGQQRPRPCRDLLAEWFVEQIAPGSAGGRPRRRRPGRRQLPGSEPNTHRGARAHTAPLAANPRSGVRHGRRRGSARC